MGGAGDRIFFEAVGRGGRYWYEDVARWVDDEGHLVRAVRRRSLPGREPLATTF